MTRRMSVIVCIALSFIFLFIAVGYAALSDDMNITGKAEIYVPEGLFITEIITSGTNNVDHQSVSFVQYTTTVDSTIDKKNDTTTTTSSRPGRPGTTTTTTYAGSVTYRVTVFNNTNYEYAYRGLYYQKNLSGYNGNSSVEKSNSDAKLGVVVTFDNGDSIVAPGETLTFTVVYTVGKSMDDDTDWKTFLNFQFGINVESEAAAIDAVHSKFLNILNTPSTYTTLYEAIDDKFDGAQEWTSNYMGNVSDAVDADSYVVETLFAGQLNMIINGVVTPATVLIKHEALDNNNLTGDSYTVQYNNSSTPTTYRGCEMTLYLTIDPLTTANGLCPVYVTVFTCDSDENGNVLGKWYKIGDTYYGKTNIVGYKGEYGGTGSFVTDNWIAYEEYYSPVSDYSYTVPEGDNIKNITRVVDQNAINAFQRLLNDAKSMIDDLTYAGTGITIVEEAYEAARRYYTLDENGNPVAIQNVTRAQLIPIMTNIDYALIEAQKAIDELYKQ